jgi:uncharacterized protein
MLARLEPAPCNNFVSNLNPPMNLRLLILALATTVALHADPIPVFNATLTMGKEHRFVLVSEAGKSSSWLKLGDSFEGYTVKAFDAKAAALDLERDGKITRVMLVGDAAVANAPMPTPGTIADAENVLRVMKFYEMLKKVAAQQSKAMEPMMRQMTSQMKGVDQEKLIAFQKKIMDEMMSVITGPETQAAMAKAYSEVFSKDELDGLANFYSTPVGQAVTDKQPEVSQKLNAFLMPRIMQTMPKIQQMAKDFAAEQKAAQAAAPAESAALATPATPPPGTP